MLASTHLLSLLFHSAERECQVRAIVEFLAEHERKLRLTIVGGDVNAAPDSDEIRLLTGRRPPASPGWVFLDAWETRGGRAQIGSTTARSGVVPSDHSAVVTDLRY